MPLKIVLRTLTIKNLQFIFSKYYEKHVTGGGLPVTCLYLKWVFYHS